MARAPAFFALLLISGLLVQPRWRLRHVINPPRRNRRPRRNWPNDRSSATAGAAASCGKAAGSSAPPIPATTASVARQWDRRDATHRSRSVS